MGVLDQIFDDSESPTKNPVAVDAFDSASETVLGVLESAHQAMKDGFNVGGDNVKSLERIPRNASGTLDAARSLQLARDYKKILQKAIIDQQFEDVRYRPTSDDVFDGGMKKGSKVVIRVVEEDATFSSGSWDEVVRKNIEGTTGRPLSVTFDKFSVNSITEPDQERQQIIQTFGADLIYGFGRRPRRMRLTGQVLNGKMSVHINGSVKSMDWKNALLRKYADQYRLTACMRNKKRIMLYAQDTVYIGYLLDMQSFTSAATQSASNVTLTFVVAERSFPEENDEKIPGVVDNDGFVVTDKTVPEEMFPSSAVEHYFKEDLSTELDNSIAELEDRIRKKTAEIAREIDDPTPAGDIQDTFQKYPEGGLYTPIEGLKLHKAYRDLGICDETLEHLKGLRQDVEDAKAQFESGDIPEAELQEVQSEFESSSRKFSERARKLNQKAEDLIFLLNGRDALKDVL